LPGIRGDTYGWVHSEVAWFDLTGSNSAEAADGGTILLDEIGEMSKNAQIYLLRVLQEQTIKHVGATTMRQVDVRVIAVTDEDLEQEAQNNHFREDLFFRLSVFPIHLPPLRERIGDISMILDHFPANARDRFDRTIDGVDETVLHMMKRYPRPVNIRALENEAYRAVALAEDGSIIQRHHFSPRITEDHRRGFTELDEEEHYTDALNRFRKHLISHVLRQCNGSKAARRLGMHRPNLIALINRLKIKE
jgi:transcriptional regulator with PAS, ATPase and Fis domain